jgi:hypothetical protein
MKKDGTPSKGSNVQCRTCGGFKHTTEKCRTPKHLVALYQKSLGKDKKAMGLGSGYGAHFFIPTNSTFEAGCLHGPEQYYGGICFERQVQ